MQKNNKAFSFIELLVVVSILVLLASIGLSLNSSYKEKTDNAKVETDLDTLQNSFLSFKQAENKLPVPMGNNNYFKVDTSYGHSGDTDNFGVYGAITSDIIPAKYLNYLPIDPKTNSNYVYGKTLDEKFFEIAGVLKRDDVFETKIVGNYKGEIGPVSLIREYNGPKFLSNGSTMSFPYNPNELLMTASIGSYSGSVYINNNTVAYDGTQKDLVSGDSVKVGTGGFAEVYFSDGSVSLLGDASKETKITIASMTYTDDSIFTKIKLALESGTIWTKATSLESESEFDIYSADSAAAVRGTIFGVVKNTGTDVIVKEGNVDVRNIKVNKSVEYVKNAIIKGTESSLYNNTETNIEKEEGKVLSIKSITKSSVATPAYLADRIIEINNSIPNQITDPTSYLENINANIVEVKDDTNAGGHDNKIIKFAYNEAFSGAYLGESYIMPNVICKQEGNNFVCNGINSYILNHSISLCKDIQKGSQNISSCTKAIKLKSDTKIEQNLDLIKAEAEKNNLGKDWKVVFYDGFDARGLDTATGAGNNSGSILKYIKRVLKVNKFDIWGKDYETAMTMSGFTMENGVLNASGANNFLKYDLSSLRLKDDFAIEMSVRWPALNRLNSSCSTNCKTYQLFQSDNYKLYLRESDNNTLILKNKISISNTLSITNSDFYKIKAIKEGNNYTLKINNYTETGSIATSILNNIYIGSSSSGENQWESIIDYVKIYKK